MTDQLRYEFEKFEDEELIQRIAGNWLTEEANHIAIVILEERGCQNILGKIKEAKEKLAIADRLREEKDKRQRNLFTLQILIIFSILPTIFFPIGENPTYPFVIFVVIELLLLPISIAILRGLNKKTIGILLAMIIVPLIGWLIAIIYSLKKK